MTLLTTDDEYRMNFDLSYIHRGGEISAFDFVRMLVLMEAYVLKKQATPEFSDLLEQSLLAYKKRLSSHKIIYYDGALARVHQQFTQPTSWTEVNEAFGQGCNQMETISKMEKFTDLFLQMEQVVLAIIPEFRDDPACLIGFERHAIERAEKDREREKVNTFVESVVGREVPSN